MNELLQQHGCTNVFQLPEGLKELMSDITREVLREQPPRILDFIAGYLSALLITREHGVLAVKLLDDLCDCRPSISEHLIVLGLQKHDAVAMSEIIRNEIEDQQPEAGKEKVKETELIRKILNNIDLDEDMAAKVCQIARNAYRDYWYRRNLLEKKLKTDPEEPWEVAARRTLEIYKTTKPSFGELNRATQKIQAAYRGYHVRRHLLRHLKPKTKEGPKVDLPGPPLDTAESREIDLGRTLELDVKVDQVGPMLDKHAENALHLKYNPKKTITHKADDEYSIYTATSASSCLTSRISSRKPSLKSTSGVGRSQGESEQSCNRSIRVSQVIDIANIQPRMPCLAEDELYSEGHKISFASEQPTVMEESTDQMLLGEIPEDIRDDLSEGDDNSIAEDIKASDNEEEEEEEE